MLNIRTSNINWSKLYRVFTCLVIFWTGIILLVPKQLYEPVSLVLIAIQSVLLYLTRSGNYVPDRTDTIQGVKQ